MTIKTIMQEFQSSKPGKADDELTEWTNSGFRIVHVHATFIPYRKEYSVDPAGWTVRQVMLVTDLVEVK